MNVRFLFATFLVVVCTLKSFLQCREHSSKEKAIDPGPSRVLGGPEVWLPDYWKFNVNESMKIKSSLIGKDLRYIVYVQYILNRGDSYF